MRIVPAVVLSAGLLSLCGPLAAQAVWMRVYPTNGPSARSDAAMVFDSAANRVLLFSGFPFGVPAPTNDLWSWNGSQWQLLNVAGTRPSGRTGHRLAFDSARA